MAGISPFDPILVVGRFSDSRFEGSVRRNSPMTSNPMVHVIDDDNAARDALAFLLSGENFSVRAYESARAFLDAVPAAQTGCVITDVRMPKINGLDLLRQ